MSKLSVGIVGLPNVGKSTLFNALLQKQQAFAANFPFATIEPNIGVVPVPDSRLKDLQKIVAGSPPIVPATIEFVDIAGLIAGAHKGEGLGNKFLAHIREVNAICYLLRAFKDENIIREGSIHPKDDLETLKTELDLADLESVERRESKKNKTAEELPLLKDKPTLIVLNVDEEDLKIAEQIESNFAKEIGTDKNQVVAISAKLEEELAALHPSESAIYLNELGIKKTGLERLINKAFATLGLITFLTAGEKPARQSPDGSRRLAGGEVRAWTIKKNTLAPQAAGVIHTDFEKKFIKADVVMLQDFIEFNGWKNCRDKGKVRQEGKEYEIQDGDVVEFKIGT